MYLLLDKAIQEKNKDALHAWIELTFGLSIPRKAICHNHCAPFDFVADAIFGAFRQAVARANRSGGKTLAFAVIETTLTYYHEHLEVANVGAVLNQADRAYGYVKDFTAYSPFKHNVESLTATRGKFLNGSMLQLLPGTPTAVNGPHPQISLLDEVEQMNYFAYQQALSMAQSSDSVPARTIITSTMKYAVGLMVSLIKNYRDKGLPVFEWCIWETVKALPKNNPELMAEIERVFGDELPERIDEADGYYDWQDLIAKKNDLDEEVWGVEWVCNQPERSGLVYPQFSQEANVINEDNPRREYRTSYKVNPWLPIYILEDFGFGPSNPNVNLFCQVVGNDLVVLDELYNYGKISKDNIHDTVERLKTWGVEVEDSMLDDGTITYAFPEQEVYWIPDPAGLTEIAERRRSGLNVLDPVLERSYYQLKNRIPVVRKKIADRSLQIAPDCVNLNVELMSYRNKKDRDGQYTDEPMKKDDHGPDALGYGALQLFSLVAQAQFEDQPATRPEERPLTAGLQDRIF